MKMATESSSWNREVSWNAESCTLRALERATLTREKKNFCVRRERASNFPILELVVPDWNLL